MTANELAQKFIAQAKAAQKPAERDEILRNAAYTFMGLAQNPKHARGSQRLTSIGLDFAKAASVKEPRPFVMDDFTDLLQETRQAYDEVGDDPMDLVARRREIHEERTKVEPGRASIAPESFNKDATLGRSAKIKFAPTDEDKLAGVQQIQNVAFWQGVKKEAQSMTVDANLIFLPTTTDPDLTVPANARPFGEVEFGSDGNRTKVKFDIGLGKRFTVVGNYISVSVGMDPPGFGKPSPQITAGASIGAFAAPSPAPLVLTAYVDALDPQVSTPLIPIPLKAVQLLPIQTDLALGGTAQITFLDFGGLAISQTFFVQSATTWMQPIPIFGDAAYVTVFNSNLAATANYRLPFQLAM